VKRGNGVKIGTRTPSSDKLHEWRERNGKMASVGSLAEAATYGDMIVMATLGTAAEEVIDLAGSVALAGKLLIDVTNPLDFSKGMMSGLFVGVTDSLGERLQRRLPSTKVVKCFNTVPNSQMVNPTYRDAEMLICGNDAAAKQEVTKILKDFGWKGVIDIGGIEGSRWLEALVPLWTRVGMALNTWNHIFEVRHD